MARGRASSYERQREYLLDSAAALFARQGFSGTSMNEVAAACDVSKAALYHYFRDKQELVAMIASAHVARLETLVAEVHAQRLAPEAHLRELILRFVAEYAGAQNAHRVLTEDVRFLGPEEQQRVRAAQRRVVVAFAAAVAAVRPEAAAAGMDKPLAMLLFGMINWMFTWLKPEGGNLTHADMAPVVADLFFGGLAGVGVAAAARHAEAAHHQGPRP
jgi:AcrR family transcriptional regulator